jgi:hypothetical protein
VGFATHEDTPPASYFHTFWLYLRKTARALYEQYGKPLEAEHKGEYVVISNSGKTIVGKSLTEVVVNSIERFGKGNFVFKIGSRSIGSFR